MHREAPVDYLNIFKVGQLKEDVFWRFANLYNKRLKKMMYTVIYDNGVTQQSRRGYDDEGRLLTKEPEDCSGDYVMNENVLYVFPEIAFASMLMF